jgi:hypothetical protein
MATWLFRGNPRDFDVNAYLQAHRDIRLTPRSGCPLRMEIMQDAVLRNLQAISMPSVINYKLTAVEDARLAQVWEARRVRDL